MKFLTRHLTVQTLNGLLRQPNTPHYIYRLINNITGEFYIGQCTDFDLRIEVHLTHIHKIIEPPPGDNFDVTQPVHRIFAKSIAEAHPGGNLKYRKFILNSIQIELCAVVNNADDARFLEAHYIQRNYSNPKCVNVRP